MSTLTGLVGGGGGGGAIEVPTTFADGTGSGVSAAGAGLRVTGGSTSYATVLSISASGHYTSHVFSTGPGLFADANSAVRVIIDGTTVLSTPTMFIAQNDPVVYHSIWPFGMPSNAAVHPGGIPIKFSTSLVVQHYNDGLGATSWVGYTLD